MRPLNVRLDSGDLRLLRTYLLAAFCFLGPMILFGVTGWNWIPGHVTPLYAFLMPRHLGIRHLLPPILFLLFLASLGWLRRPQGSAMLQITFLVFFSFVFNVSVAGMNDGLAMIARSFHYYGLDYFGDVPFVRDPIQFLQQFHDIRPHLSMHSRTHPPGPLIVLWVLSLLNDTDPVGVALSVTALGCLGVIPLYHLAKRLSGHEFAIHAAAIYSLCPTIVLYGAMSLNTLFALVAITTLAVFTSALSDERLAPGRQIAAGFCFALTFFMSFDMANLGVFFVVLYLITIRRRGCSGPTIKAAIMSVAFLGFYALIWAGTGFNVVHALFDAVMQVKEDLAMMEKYTPRASYWLWRVGNPFEVLFFLGIPCATAFLASWKGILHRKSTVLPEFRAFCIAGLVMILVFAMTYLGKSEMARVSSYFFPFMLFPATYWIHSRTEGGL